MELLIVCPTSFKKAVEKLLHPEVTSAWEQEGKIRILSIPDNKVNDSYFVTSQILNQLKDSADRIHVVSFGVRVNNEKLTRRVFFTKEAGIRAFERRALPTALKSLGLDWLSQLDSILRNSWHHGEIKREHIEAWINQFEKYASGAWIAKGLLRLLEFWSDSRIIRSLKITEEGLKGFDCVVVNRHLRAGKSADAIASLVKKRLDAGRFKEIESDVWDFRDAIEHPKINHILFVEDCLVTGNEMTRIFMALLGQDDPFGNKKADPLTDKASLYKKKICLRFAVVTNGGLAYLNYFLQKHCLLNIEIDLGNTFIFETLTSKGLLRISDNTLYDDDDCVLDLNENIIRVSFSKMDVWRTTEKAERAMNFCAEVGRQLYEKYLNKRGKEMIDKKLDESSLGIRSFALALAFSHSIPKETLPLFWMEANIIKNNKEFRWLALFQNGE